MRTYACRQQQPSQALNANMPAKLNPSQLRRLAGVKAYNGCCCRRRMFLHGNNTQAVSAAMSQVIQRHMRTRLNCYLGQPKLLSWTVYSDVNLNQSNSGKQSSIALFWVSKSKEKQLTGIKQLSFFIIVVIFRH